MPTEGHLTTTSTAPSETTETTETTERSTSEVVADVPSDLDVSTSTRQLLAVLSCGLVALPFFTVTIPPMADLPQHLAQIRLLLEALGDPVSPYSVQWLTPYSAAYVVLGALWSVVEPFTAGRLGGATLVLASTAALHVVAARRGRSPWAAVLASLLVFSHTLYWGFFTFVSGFPIFLLWLEIVSRSDERFRLRDAAIWSVCAFVLYLTHALWFGAGAVSLVALLLWERRSVKDVALRLATLTPVAVAVSFWLPRFNRGFSTPPEWWVPAWSRVSPLWWADSSFGGLHGSFEWFVAAVIFGWMGAALWTWRGRLRGAIDERLLLVAMLFVLVAIGAPDKYMNTIHFASRWAAPALALLLLALPAPRLRRPVVPTVAVGLALTFSLVTAASWATYEATELDGLEEAIEALPENQRVLGLDFLRNSQVVRGRPFLQTFAWAQVVKGGELNFSFADFAPSLVKYDPPREKAWNPALEWYPQRVQARDFLHFDHVLASGTDEAHAALAGFRELEPVTDAGVWRLYRVQ